MTDTALEAFTEYFVRNYPGPDTVIFDPKWHAPKIFAAARNALSASPAQPVAWLSEKYEGKRLDDTHVTFARSVMESNKSRGYEITPLYAQPPAVPGEVKGWQPIETKPFSTYPEDRELMMSLARTIQTSHDIEVVDQAASKLSDLVLAILSDEATDDFDRELDATELMMIDQAWEKHKAAGPAAKVINDNQQGNTAIIEVLRDPPTLEVGTLLFAAPSATLTDAGKPE